MAKNKNQPRFEVEDFERLFRAILPDGRPNPFGEIAEALSLLAERFETEIKVTQAYRDKAEDSRDDIKSRTFGILFLQIFKTLKFFFGLLPQGRVILIIIAVIGIGTALMQNKSVSLGAVRDAVRSTGIGDFIDKVLKELKEEVGEMATELGDLADVISVTVAQSAGKFETVEQLLAIAQEDLATAQGFFTHFQGQFAEGFEELGGQAQEATNSAIAALTRGLAEASLGGNALANIDVFFTPTLRKIPGQLQQIPDLAQKLIRFG